MPVRRASSIPSSCANVEPRPHLYPGGIAAICPELRCVNDEHPGNPTEADSLADEAAQAQVVAMAGEFEFCQFE